MINVLPNIQKMAPYAPPWTGMDRTGYIRMDLNEYTLDPPDFVVETLRKFVESGRIQMYPDYADFMPRLAEYTGVPENQLIVTNGSDHALEIVLRSFLQKDDPMVIAEPCFPMFNNIASVIGARLVGIPYPSDFRFPFDAFMNALSSEIKLAVIINPDNPTGAGVALSDIEKILDRNPDIPVLVDEAYFEFTGITSLGLLDRHANLIISRTFSKAFAMAGLRLGYLIGKPEIISEFQKVRGPFDVNSAAIAAAGAQLEHPEAWKAYVRETMDVSKPYLEKFFTNQGVRFFAGNAHFMLVWPKNLDAAVKTLKENRILVRPMTARAIEGSFRMNVGTSDQMKQFEEAYSKYLDQYEK